jgi:SRSO17 transposase
MAKLGACVQEWPEPFGDEAWLIGEHRTSREKKYYLANLPVRTLAATVKARWICEQAHQQLKEELGLDHFEGRSWSRSHDNDRLRRLATSSPRTSGAEKKNQRISASTKLAGRAPSHRRSHSSTAISAMLILQKTNPLQQINLPK